MGSHLVYIIDELVRCLICVHNQRAISRHPVQPDGGRTRQTPAVRAEAEDAQDQPEHCHADLAAG